MPTITCMPGKPCHELRQLEESPRLPHGYFVMALMVRLRNDRYREFVGRELRERGLEPFRPGHATDTAVC